MPDRRTVVDAADELDDAGGKDGCSERSAAGGMKEG
jgi:hypothetical protein